MDATNLSPFAGFQAGLAGQMMAAPGQLPTVEVPVAAPMAAQGAGCCLAAFWRAVGAGRLPAPVYPAARAPRWYPSEIRAALEATRALPAVAKAARRQAKISAGR